MIRYRAKDPPPDPIDSLGHHSHRGEGAHRIITGERRLEPGMLQELVSHRAAAIHIRGFYPEAASHALAERLLARDRQSQADDALAGDGSWKVGG